LFINEAEDLVTDKNNELNDIFRNQPENRVLTRQNIEGNITNENEANIILEQYATLKGDIKINKGNITLLENSVMEGEIYVLEEAKITIGKHSKISGRIHSQGEIIISDNVKIGGKLESSSVGNFIKIGDYVEIKEGISVYTKILEIGNGFNTDSDVEMKNDSGKITISDHANIGGNLKNSSGDITIGQNNIIKGKVNSGGKFIQGNYNKIGD
jgi:predicted acyltransferase (DUF342 family)